MLSCVRNLHRAGLHLPEIGMPRVSSLIKIKNSLDIKPSFFSGFDSVAFGFSSPPWNFSSAGNLGRFWNCSDTWVRW